MKSNQKFHWGISMNNNHEKKSIDQSKGKSLGKFSSMYVGIFLKWLFLSLAVVFILMGIQRGETQDVLRKAVNICMECIGIG